MRFQVRKWLWRPVEYVLAATLKAFVMGAVFVVCASVLMRWLGYDVPGLSQMGEYFQSVARLSDLLS